MGKNPAMPFYVGDWLASTSVTLMTPAERGGYLHLLCHAWASQQAALPDDDDALAALSGLGQGWFNGGSTKIRKCFQPHPELEGKLTNPRLWELWQERVAWIKKSAAGGRKSAAARKKRRAKGGSTTVATKRQAKGNSPSPSSSPSSSPSMSPAGTWEEVEVELADRGVVAAKAAVTAARNRGATVEDVRSLLAQFDEHPGRYGAGALQRRVAGDLAAWPPRRDAGDNAAATVAKQEAERREKVRRDRQRQAELEAAEQLESQWGDQFDRLASQDVEELARDVWGPAWQVELAGYRRQQNRTRRADLLQALSKRSSIREAG